MMKGKRLLLLNGSPRKNGTSFSFARTVKMLTEDYGNTAEIIHVIDYFDGKEKIDLLKEHILQSDIIAMSAPLYADTLPSFDIWLLEKLAGECRDALTGKRFFAIGQCGFPDITRIEPLLDTCRFFAEEMEMKWLGGLAFGGGPMINGARLEDIGKKGEKIINGLKLALEAVLRDEKIPSRAQALVALKIPKLLYWTFAVFLNRRAKKLARENGNVDFAGKVYLE